MVTPEDSPVPPSQPVDEKKAPHLDPEFFSKLIRQPECVTKGTCNGCGRCEH